MSDERATPSVYATNALLLALTLLVVLSVTELALRWLYPRSDRYYVLPPNQTLVQRPVEDHMPGVRGDAVYQTSSWGIRGDEFGLDGSEYRILAIGGSTTQNAYLDQAETWTLLLGQQLGRTSGGLETWTGDVGRSGHTARSHVLQLQMLLEQLPPVDAVVILVGVNDLTVALRDGFAYARPAPLSDPDAARRQIQEAFVQVPGGLHERLTNYQSDGVPFYKRLALYQLARLVKIALEQSSSGLSQDPLGEIYPTWRKHRAEAPTIHDTLPDLSLALEEYRSTLDTMIDIAREHGTRLVLVTQPTLWKDVMTDAEEAALWLGGIGDFQNEPGHEYFSPGALAEAMEAYNSELLDACSDGQAECVDLAVAVPKDLTNFYDDVHFTEQGSLLVAEVLAEHFRQRPPYLVER